jgi:hypothetical protein
MVWNMFQNQAPPEFFTQGGVDTTPDLPDRDAAKKAALRNMFKPFAAATEIPNLVGNELMEALARAEYVGEGNANVDTFLNYESAEQAVRDIEEVREDYPRASTQNLEEMLVAGIEALPQGAQTFLTEFLGDPRMQNQLSMLYPAIGGYLAGQRGIIGAVTDAAKRADVPATPTVKDSFQGGSKQKGIIVPAEEAIRRAEDAGMPEMADELANMYAQAQFMLKEGYSPLEISKATEFHPVPTGEAGVDQLFWEVPGEIGIKGSQAIDFNVDPTTGNKGQYKVGDLFDLGETMDLILPEVRDVSLFVAPKNPVGSGGWSRQHNAILLGGKGEAQFRPAHYQKRGEDLRRNYPYSEAELKTMLDAGVHEIGHKGQTMFDLGRGGSPSLFEEGDYLPQGARSVANPNQEVRILTEAINKGYDPTELAERMQITEPALIDALQETAVFKSALPETLGVGDTATQGQLFGSDLDPFLNSVAAKHFRNMTSTQHQKYEQLWGEAASNADMERNLMTPQARLNFPYAEHMAMRGGVDNPRLLRWRDPDTGDFSLFDEDRTSADSFTGGSKQRGEINMFGGIDFTPKKLQTVSTRIPSDVQQRIQGIDAHNRDDLLVSASLMSPEKFEQGVDIFRGYPAFKNLSPDPQEAFSQARNVMANNLHFMLDLMPDKWREMSEDWYLGYNKLSQGLGANHGVADEQAAGVIAVLSPQTDWFQNLTRADRIMDIYNTRQDFKWDSKMDAIMPKMKASINEKKYKDKLPNIIGKQLNQLDDPAEKAMWIRAYDEAHNTRDYHLFSPKGERLGLAKTKAGENRKANWAATSPIEKAVRIIEDGSIENISKQLGQQHKVRSFFRNAADPWEETTTTMDTHAIAANLLTPYAAASEPVAHNFGSVLADATTGMRGTYPLHQEAYTQVGRELGIPGRQVQSPTWEFGKNMFEGQKGKKNREWAEGVWRAYGEGKITELQARQLLVEGFDIPESPYR